MNYKLLDALRAGMTEDRRKQIASLVHESGAADHPLIQEVTEIEMAKMVNIASLYISRACTVMVDNDPSWVKMSAATELVQGLDDIMKNPATINYTQAIMMLTVALLTEGEAEEPPY